MIESHVYTLGCVWLIRLNKNSWIVFYLLCIQLITEYFNNLSDSCIYSSLPLHQNSTNGSFLKNSCKIESETLSMSFHSVTLKFISFQHALSWPPRSLKGLRYPWVPRDIVEELLDSLSQGYCLPSLLPSFLKSTWYLADSNQMIGQAHWNDFLKIVQLDLSLEFKPTYLQCRPLSITNQRKCHSSKVI